MRRRGEQQDTSGRLRQHVHCPVTLGLAARIVRLVDHDQIPRMKRQRRQHVRLFQVVERRDPDAGLAPGILVSRAGAGEVLDGRAVGFETGQTELALEFSRPLAPHRRGHEDQHAQRVVPARQFGDDQSGLNRLAETDLVGDQHAPRTREHRERGLELMGQHRDGCLRSSPQRSHAPRLTTPPREPRARVTPAGAPQPFALVSATGRSNGDRNVTRRARPTTSIRTICSLVLRWTTRQRR